MKPATIEKINGLGKAAYIIATIVKVLAIIAIVCILIGMIVCAALPKNLFRIDMTAAAAVEVDLGTLGVDLTDIPLEDIADTVKESGTLSLNSMELSFDGIRKDGSRLIVNASGGGTVFSSGSLQIILIGALLAMIAALTVTVFVCSFCKSLKNCTTPFDPDLVRKMRNLAWAMLCLPVIKSLSESLASTITSGSIQFSLSVDLEQIILILALFALAYIFKYGAQLQLESDETL